MLGQPATGCSGSRLDSCTWTRDRGHPGSSITKPCCGCLRTGRRRRGINPDRRIASRRSDGDLAALARRVSRLRRRYSRAVVVVLIGIGSDILQIERLRRSLAKFGNDYLEEVFSELELARSNVPANLTEAEFFSRGFCAKEACAKALGTGIDENVDWYDISVDQLTLPPTIALSGGAMTRLTALTPAGFQSRIALALGSKEGLAYAYVTISVFGAAAVGQCPLT